MMRTLQQPVLVLPLPIRQDEQTLYIQSYRRLAKAKEPGKGAERMFKKKGATELSAPRTWFKSFILKQSRNQQKMNIKIRLSFDQDRDRAGTESESP